MNDIVIRVARGREEVAAVCSPDRIATSLVQWLGDNGDDLANTRSALDFALDTGSGREGFLVLATQDDRLVGALVMLDTCMAGFIPRYHLVYVGVDDSMRGHGLGAKIVQQALDTAGEPVSLHVGRDNPAIRLYERLGFEQKYVEMRTG